MTATSDPVTASYLDKTRIAYDVVAADYADLARDLMAGATWDRAVLGAFAEIASGPVADVGCGPGRITGHLAGLGLAARGIDLSPAMIEVARRDRPGLSFEVGSLLDLDLPDGDLGGLVAWYSLVHTPRELLPVAFAEFFRVLRPGGHVLLAFKAGGQRRTLTSGYGHDDIDLDVYEFPPDLVIELLTEAGFTERMRLVRAAEEREKQPQAYVLGVKS
ncbi:class I SAM-dependent DNA methyltransferase [Paractinoplanes globisporus]|uniref:Class I SAM-dependent DNA methyltransferase n=1 Tax=Paractinoplanes globisporus TaxID=113565 RepID=A0ABW6WNY8_9ACTN|nr:class I SAM-dependent methyltransferase [Actinoplanes globisporus]